MRDLRDCFMRGVAQSSGEGTLYNEAQKGEQACICEADLYKIKEMDIMAVCQNMTCEVERLMGIFPNTPSLSYEEIVKIIPLATLTEDQDDDG